MNTELAQILGDILSVDRPLDGSESLSILGLDSLSVIRLVVKIEEDLHIRFPEEALQASTFLTVDSLSAVVSDLVKDAGI
ncbi:MULTISPECIES: phosphopantetheine-binding protein [Gammaproteobacteria]|uniref:phosphopantetheine-binding protein n=1 Tax=Gammaproteobacteria TaxID=1236 RepID=UPI000808F7AB|nr:MULTISPECIES: phosphopantetheine-binding protein [Enterobacterales]MDI3363649.1 phosphopantetheine-binding protein [Pantoea sp. V108_6]MDN4130041.1 phosphopantetheine-binding protein [Pantoea ananatis]SBY69307.1 acyl carrier protein [Klebsiella pneumoniae]HBR1627772.1 hypothetical protein [Klebsiella pneumoniae]HBR2054525.1 hypothetical protein [Klebsiella pneumoniae]